MSEILPIPPLVSSAKKLGHVHVELDEDGLARGIYLNSGIGDDHWPALSMAMAMETNPMIRYQKQAADQVKAPYISCLLYTSPSPRDGLLSRMPSSA